MCLLETGVVFTASYSDLDGCSVNFHASMNTKLRNADVMLIYLCNGKPAAEMQQKPICSIVHYKKPTQQTNYF